eukprot:TRINITY_DN49650_c0_g1_i1.p1 TRINITY_DN49650_c0_g1~~TRINITY_DN49650_c0_g1_i1.p1  ORF type:complete len:375 (-),score=31.20 TRINITY_DN49650_c0_g1_i1:246-1370(-)
MAVAVETQRHRTCKFRGAFKSARLGGIAFSSSPPLHSGLLSGSRKFPRASSVLPHRTTTKPSHPAPTYVVSNDDALNMSESINRIATAKAHAARSESSCPNLEFPNASVESQSTPGSLQPTRAPSSASSAESRPATGVNGAVVGRARNGYGFDACTVCVPGSVERGTGQRKVATARRSGQPNRTRVHNLEATSTNVETVGDMSRPQSSLVQTHGPGPEKGPDQRLRVSDFARRNFSLASKAIGGTTVAAAIPFGTGELTHDGWFGSCQTTQEAAQNKVSDAMALCGMSPKDDSRRTPLTLAQALRVTMGSVDAARRRSKPDTRGRFGRGVLPESIERVAPRQGQVWQVLGLRNWAPSTSATGGATFGSSVTRLR